MDIKSSVWFSNKEKGYFGKGRIELLEQIALTGSISKAAKAMKMSYKSAWDAVNEMNTLSAIPIVKRESGGKGGGGTVLTDKGREYIALYKEIEDAQRRFFSSLGAYAENPEKLLAFTSKLTLRTSARNQLHATVTAIEKSKTKAEVRLLLEEDLSVVVMITLQSLKELDVKQGTALTILLKSAWVDIVATLPSSLVEMNSLQGDIIEIEQGDESDEVTIMIAPHIPLIGSVKKGHSLQVGDRAWALFDTSSALLAI